MPWLRKYRILGDLEKEAKSSESMQLEKLRMDIARLEARNLELTKTIEEREKVRHGDGDDDDDLSYISTDAASHGGGHSKTLFKEEKDKDI